MTAAPIAQQIPLTPEAVADWPDLDDGTTEIAIDLAYKRLALVNAVFYGSPGAGDRGWTLIDAGVPGAMGFIERAAAKRFGAGARPAAIILTHGHFDHVGSLERLSAKWDVEVFAHTLEFPYLNGAASYPPPDPKVGGGVMPLLAPLFPRAPVDVSARLRALPADGSVPTMPGWRWLHTPGHSPGHVSLWRESDRAMIAGDAFITTNQESAYSVLVQEPQMHGPPKYFTPDWDAARSSVEQLATLDPELVVTGHGRAMRGAEMRDALRQLARDFASVAVPANGRYVAAPARAEDGTAYLNP